MLRLDLENRPRLQITQKHPTINLGLNNVVVDVIAEVGVRQEHLDLQVWVHGVGRLSTIDVCIIPREAREGKYFRNTKVQSISLIGVIPVQSGTLGRVLSLSSFPASPSRPPGCRPPSRVHAGLPG